MSLVYAFVVGLVIGAGLVFVYYRRIISKLEQAKKLIP